MDVSQKILSDIIVYMKYARYIPELKRRETWGELIDRNKNMHLKRFPELREEIENAYKFVYEKKVLPSMRSLQFGGKPIELSAARQYNCSTLQVDDYRSFSETMFLLLSGTGVGYSVQKKDIEKLPFIRKPIHRKRKFVIGDSIEGWSDAIKVLMRSYFEGTSHIDFCYDDIRPKGAQLITSGGKAPGPQPLKDCIHNITKILDNKNDGEKLSSLECHDIMCFIADCVLSGGIRRAAMLALFDFDDEEMATCKYGNWWESNPQRARANNSAQILRHRITEQEFMSFWKKIEKSGCGEPGFFFSNNSCTNRNPCLVGATKIALADGRGEKTIKDLADEGLDVPVYCLDKQGRIVIRYMRNPRLTGEKVPVYKVNLDDGSHVITTDSHKFRLTNSKYKEVKDLKSGDSLSVMNKRLASIKEIFPKANSRSQDYWWIGMGDKNSKSEHRLIAEFAYNTKIDTGYVVHHKDYNAQNNLPSNLEIMTKSDHDKLHAKDMMGDKNPMRRAKYEWSEEKWAEYRKKHSVNNSGAKNSNSKPVTNEELKEYALELTKSLERRFSQAEWKEFAVPRNLPYNFTKWRNDHLGGIIGLAKWAASELGYDNLDVDPRVVRTFKRLSSDGYNCEIKNGLVFVIKNCEVCNTEFSIKHERRENGVCSLSCAQKRAREKYGNYYKGHSEKYLENRENLRKTQASIYNDLKFKLGRDPEKKEWVVECKARNISVEICRKSSPFLNWKKLKEYASNLNHKVVSVEFYGYEDVYNGTVDEFHNFFVGGFESTTESGKRKLFYINNLQCGEIALKNTQFCNLCEINGDNIEDQEDFNARAKAASFIGTLQASYTDFHYLRDGWRKTTEKEALLGVGITGICSGKILKLNITEACQKVLDENDRVAKLLGINRSARLTTTKPSGTSSIVLGCSSGVHGWFAKYYIRRVRVGKNESIYKYLAKNHPELVEDDYFKPTTQAIISIPQKAPENAIFRDEDVMDMLERVKRMNLEWIYPGHRRGDDKHNCSATVYIKEGEWDKVGKWLWENKESYAGMSFLPYDGGTYVQTPFEEISESRYHELYEKLKDVDLTKIVEENDETDLKEQVACAGGSCEL